MSTVSPCLHSRRVLLAAAFAAFLLMAKPPHAVASVPGGYAADLDYGRGALVVGSDGNVYRALDAVKGKDPVAAKDETWQLAHAAFDITLDVPGRFESIEKAFAFLAGATISDTATVTIQLAPGTYERKGPLAVGHSQGNRVVLKGSKDPSNTSLKFGRGSGIVVDDGKRLRMEGMVLEGGRTGLTVDHGATVTLTNVVIKNFRVGVLVDNRSTISAERVVIESEDGDWGVKVTSTSRGWLHECTVTRTKPSLSIADSTFGVDAETNSSIACHDCEVRGWMTGVHAGRSGSIEMWDCKACENVYGGGVYLAASISAFDSTFENNRERGVQVHGGSAMFANCEFRGNKKMGISSSNNAVVDFMGTPCAISGSELGLHSFRGGRFHGVAPQLTGNTHNTDVFPAGSAQEDPFLLRR